MGRNRIKGSKYNRVTQQQKYIFLKLCISEGQTIHQAAHNSGIHYSTAKTILFFHKKKFKNYTTYVVNDPTVENSNSVLIRATWRDIVFDANAKPTERPNIQLIVNSKYNDQTLSKKTNEFRESRKQVKQKKQVKKDVKLQENEHWVQFCKFDGDKAGTIDNYEKYPRFIFEEYRQIKIEENI